MELTYLVRGADGKQYGPVTLEQLGSWVQEGRLRPEAQIRRSDMQHWAVAEDFAELQPLFGIDAPQSAVTSSYAGATVAQADPATLAQLKSGASWFYWIAGLSLINSIAAFSGSTWRFIVGLGITQVFDEIGKGLGDSGRFVALGVDLLAAGLFVVFGVFAHKAQSWAFLVGMVLFGLDGVIFLLGSHWLGVAFHALVLYWLFRGFTASQNFGDSGLRMNRFARYFIGSVTALLVHSAASRAQELHWWERGISRTISVSTGFAGPDKFDPAELAGRKAALGFNAERLTIFGRHQGMDDQGFFFVSSRAGKTNADYLKRYLTEDKRRGLRSAVFFDVHHYSASFGAAHPDWMQRNEDDSLPKIYDTGVSPCVNSPYRDWVFQILRDLAKYPIDGVFFDGPIFFPDSCYCQNCQRKWAGQNPGRPMPSKKLRTGLEFSRLLDFQSHSLSDFLHDARMALKANNPELVLYMNSGVRGANWASARMNRVLIDQEDILGSEGGFLSGDLTRMSLWKPGLTARLLERQAVGKPTQIFTAVSHKPWTFSLLPGPELGLCFFDSLANGAACSFAFTPDDLNQPETRNVAELNEYLARNERYYVGTHSEARTALVWSDVTANYYAGATAQMIDIDRIAARSEIGNLDGEFNGMAEALVRSHTPFDVVDDFALERESMARYKTLILPNVACMNDAVAARLGNWVKNGGTLVATFETGLYDQTGLQRTNFALAQVMGLKAVGKIVGPMLHDYMKTLQFGNSRSGRALMEATTYHVPVKCETAKAGMEFMKPLAGRYDGLPDLSDEPALTEQQHGKGKVIYFSGDLGNSIQNFHLAEHLDLLKPWFASPVQLENTPGSVEVVIRSQAAGTRWLVHLVNATGEMTRPIRAITPARDIRIDFPPERTIRKVTAVRSGQKLRAGQTVVLPLLRDYELLVIE